MGVYRPMTSSRQHAAREEEPPALLNIGSMSPPGYPSAWLRPRSARFRFARQDHCSSAAPCCSQLPGCPPLTRIAARQRLGANDIAGITEAQSEEPANF
jgi:hypothetical protein